MKSFQSKGGTCLGLGSFYSAGELKLSIVPKVFSCGDLSVKAAPMNRKP
jgi:hypothetical protein